MGPKSRVTIQKPNKKLGQNFFNNKQLAERIVYNILESEPDLVIEIGPGRGVFTHLLSKKTSVLAIEKDKSLAVFLQSYLVNNKAVSIINEDILSFDWNLINRTSAKKHYKPVLFGSLPYNISKRIIRENIMLEGYKYHYYIIQEEVAQKYLANKGKNNRLAILSDIFVKKTLVLKINRNNFTPVPKVTSALIKLERITPKINIDKFSEFEGFINRSFASPRKMLSSNLKGSVYLQVLDSENANLRAEDLSTDQFISIFNSAHKG